MTPSAGSSPPHAHRACFATNCDLDHDAIDREFQETPIGPHMLAPNEIEQYEAIRAVMVRHQFHDHDCQTVDCKAMFLYDSAEMTWLLADAYQRGFTDGQVPR